MTQVARFFTNYFNLLKYYIKQYKKQYKRRYIKHCIKFGAMFCGLVFYMIFYMTSCAKTSYPSGGPKDVDPPKFIKSIPDTFSKNVKTSTKEVKIYFDELVLLKDPSQIIISPPIQKATFDPSSMADKHISIKFNEPLEENTTYAINFGESIQDNNEGNKYPLFTYVFSTGSVIDNFTLKGRIRQGLFKKIGNKTLLALYKQDSIPVDLSKKPYYITKSDSLGNYEFKYLHKGNYRLLAYTKELNAVFDSEKDSIAVFPSAISISSSSTKEAYNLVLYPVIQKYRVDGIKQKGEGEIEFLFKGNPKEINIIPLQNMPKYYISRKKYSDSLYLIFDNKELINNQKDKKGQKDKRVDFQFIVENKEFGNKKDTVKLSYDKTKENHLAITGSSFSDRNSFYLNFNTFIKSANNQKIRIEKDSQSVNYTISKDSLNIFRIKLNFPTQFGEKYKISIYPEAFKDFSGNMNKDTLNYTLMVPKENELGSLTIRIKNPLTSNYFFQLLNEKMKVEKEIYGKEEEFIFNYLKPGKYNLRILEDANGNGRWDAFNLETYQAAEKTYIYPKEVEVRALWKIEEEWELK